MPLQMTSCCRNAVNIVVTTVFAAVVLFTILLAYITGYQFIQTEQHHLSFGLYGAFLSLHLLLQSLFAFLEHRQMKIPTHPQHLRRTVALCIAAYQEDPDYLRKCLRSIRRISFPGLKVVLVVDGNRPEDRYMMDIFQEVMGGADQAGSMVWKGNYHSDGSGGVGVGVRGGVRGSTVHMEEALRVTRLVRSCRFSCIMQEWGGKREVMYTAFKALGDTVDYVQVCDSDTVLDPACTIEMLKIFEEDTTVGGVGGDVQILNKYDSWISFLSSVRYWMAFNIERACQSYFGCVQCISGPLGMYRNCLLQRFLEAWYHQTFLGSKCSFGDDRHLTNRVLSFGYKTKYTARSQCQTETPTQYLRWLNQQTRWIIHLFYRGRLWNILLFLLTVQLVGMLKATYACFLRGSLVMIFMSLYSLLYMSSLLPAKIFALLTINKAGWGTSGRRKLVVNLIGAVPVTVWTMVLLGGVVYTIYCETQQPLSESEKVLLISGTILYACYWLILLVLYLAIVAKRCNKRQEQYRLPYVEA
ncbi:hyaluronan synthase 3 isoform X3 [Syngnathus acus]|uniref:hyaluronan synthase 3 isoform X3 n=1 Tax=Syngnathus acus TaxID=161584 RepID=UPI001885B8B3|nr:hyaluronan synthase 3 isoform X3 [Syngnathus acus]